MAGFNQVLLRLTDSLIDYHDRFGRTCDTGKCSGLPTYAIQWDYVTGRRGRVGKATRQVCTRHGEMFAKKHDLRVSGTYADQRSFFAETVNAWEGGDHPVDFVRVHHTRGMQWYLERRRTGSSSLLSRTQQWMPGVPGTAPLAEAIAGAEADLARDRLVTNGAWELGDGEASARVIDAERSPAWARTPWLLTITKDRADSMWTLTRTLDRRFPPITDRLGFQNMNLERAMRVANALLDEQQWVGVDLWSWDPRVVDEALVVRRKAWHPAQRATADVGPEGAT